MTEIVLKVTGMSCEHCRASVSKALSGVHGVDRVAVDLEDGRAHVVYDTTAADVQRLIKAVVDEGYEAEVA